MFFLFFFCRCIIIKVESIVCQYYNVCYLTNVCFRSQIAHTVSSKIADRSGDSYLPEVCSWCLRATTPVIGYRLLVICYVTLQFRYDGSFIIAAVKIRSSRSLLSLYVVNMNHKARGECQDRMNISAQLTNFLYLLLGKHYCYNCYVILFSNLYSHINIL